MLSDHLNPDYYQKVLSENGYENMRDRVRPIDFSLGSLSPEQLSLAWLCHHDCNAVADIAAVSREKTKVITGIGLSGVPHLGTLSQIMKAIKLQQQGGLAVKFVLGDLDAYNGKGTSLEKTRYLAEQVRQFMLRIGFDDSGRNELQSQFDELEILRTTYLAGRFMEDEAFHAAEEDLHSFYVEKGKVDSTMSFRRKLSLALMVGGWYHQQIDNGESNLLITLGIDEHQYVQFGQNVLAKMKHSPEFRDALSGASISAMYSTLIKGFNGFPKMSKSFPESGITLDMSRDQIHRLIMEGEGTSVSPQDNIILQCIASASTFTPAEVESAFEAYKQQGKAWESMKQRYSEDICSLVEKWQNEIDI